jgi:hypothetical protein
MSFISFDTADSIITSEAITGPLWSNNVYTLTSGSMFTSSVQEASTQGTFYLNVNNLAIATSGSELQYSIAYGHVSGSGSAPFNTAIPGATPTKVIYEQYYNTLYAGSGITGSLVNFGGSNGQSKDMYIVNISRSRYKESLKPGSLNLRLSSGSTVINLTDDSNNTSTVSYIGANRVYNLVSGSNGVSFNSSSLQTNSGSYGIFLPDIATVILNPRALALTPAQGGIGLVPNETPSTSYTLAYNANNNRLYNSIRIGNGFSLSSQETVSARYYDVHVKYGELNYTTNPSVIDSNGNIIYNTMIYNPQTFVTTVGLYNEQNELLAVAKLSKPLTKDFTKTLTLRVKLQA